MHTTIGNEKLLKLISCQIDSNFILEESEKITLSNTLTETLTRCETNFSANQNKYYSDAEGNTQFDPYHSGQYTVFLYFLSRRVAAAGNTELADKIYYLNRMMNGLDLFYQTELPDVFFHDHPLGSVLGKADYGSCFCFQQGCTVGNNHGQYPTIGEYVRMFANSSIIGRCSIGNNVFISAGVLIKDEDVPPNTIVFGRSPNLTFKAKPADYFLKSSPFKRHHA